MEGEIERLWVTEVDRESLGLQHARDRDEQMRRSDGRVDCRKVEGRN